MFRRVESMWQGGRSQQGTRDWGSSHHCIAESRERAEGQGYPLATHFWQEAPSTMDFCNLPKQTQPLKSVCLNTWAWGWGALMSKPCSMLCVLGVWGVSDALQSPIWNINIANNAKGSFKSLSYSLLCLLRQQLMWILRVSLVLRFDCLHDIQLWTCEQHRPDAVFKYT